MLSAVDDTGAQSINYTSPICKHQIVMGQVLV